MVPCKKTAEEVSFEWSHHRISSTDSKVRTPLNVSIIDSASGRVFRRKEQNATYFLPLGSRFVLPRLGSRPVRQGPVRRKSLMRFREQS